MIDLALLEVADAAYGSATIETETCHVLMRESLGETIIAFRGTDNFTDLRTDASLLSVEDPVLGDLHNGFFECVTSLAWRIVHRLKPPVLVTGHSKGGSEALIFSAMLVHLGLKPCRVTTFGAARCGKLGGLLIDVEGVDYRNGADPVPFLPLRFDRPRPMTQLGTFRVTIDPLDDHELAAYRRTLTQVSAGGRFDDPKSEQKR